MHAEVEAQLHANGVAFNRGDARLLRAIAEEGSVLAASETLGRSRARALTRLEGLEEAFGPLVTRQRGGAGGGGSQLTADARTLLARFDRLRAMLSGTANVPETVLTGELVKRDGQMGVVETDVGSLKALVIDEPPTETDPDAPNTTEASPDYQLTGGAVEVSIRADTVTLHDPAETPSDDATSARNRLAGTVQSIDAGQSVVHIAVDIGGTAPLVALITHESRNRLEITPGTDVIAAFKSTTTRAMAATY